MRRFTILTLMGLVLALAVGLAALRGANDYWAGDLLLATPLLFGVALIGATCGKERSRAGRLGFAVLGGVYFALAFFGLSEGNLGKLPTSCLLRYIHERVAGQQTFSVVFTTTTPPLALTKAATTVNVSGTPYGITNVAGTLNETVDANSQTTKRWRAMLPGAANYDAFQSVGHCLFALLAGLLGAVVARRFANRRTVVECRS